MSRFYWIANNLALDFVNTLVLDEKGRELDLLATFDALLDWVVEAGLTTKEAAARVKNILDLEQRKKMVGLAVDFRGELKEMARALSKGKQVPRSVIKRVNEVLGEKEGHFEIVQTARGFERRFNVKMNNVTDFLPLIAESVTELLCYGDPVRVKKCEGADCVLYFYDSSKRNGRRWCSMAACGNRAKSAAFYARGKDSGSF